MKVNRFTLSLYILKYSRVNMAMQKNTKPNLTKNQQRVLRLLFKFRFITSESLANAMSISKVSGYEVLERLVAKDLVTKEYSSAYRINRRPACYSLSSKGVSALRSIDNSSEAKVHAAYNNKTATLDFKNHCIMVANVYSQLRNAMRTKAAIFSRSELIQYDEFPRDKPDLYIRTLDNNEAMFIVLHCEELYIIRKRFDEIIAHCEDGWEYGDYPIVCFLLADERKVNGLIQYAQSKIDALGLDEEEFLLQVVAINKFCTDFSAPWITPYGSKNYLDHF